MRPISIAQLRRACGAEAGDFPREAGAFVHGVCTDTRDMKRQSLFVALSGERFDGHEFLAQAAAAGAIAALVERIPAAPPRGMHLLRVENTRTAMGRLARQVRQQMRGRVIAVAGSNGKTSTKLLIGAVLRDPLWGTVSPKSFNNDIGVPLAIFPADPMQDYLVLEIGTNHPGEVKNLAEIALPDIAVITNCSAEHLEGLGDENGVRRENVSLIDGLAPGGLLLINGDDPQLAEAVRDYRGRRVTFGFSAGNDLRATEIVCDESGVRFKVNQFDEPAYVPMLGRHSAANALAAIAVGRELGLSDRKILENLAQARGPEMRLELADCGDVRLLNDAYNANPASMKAAIETLAGLPATGRRVAVVGEMRELGEASESLHREIGRFIAVDFPPDLLVCVGKMGQAIAAEARRNGLADDRVEYFADAAAACAVARRLRRGDLVLLKGSRAVRLETVARAIEADAAGRAS
ncbi:MAG: UDP-N-acetylmuramoyl-tripeptide--D-alanyl-D-alanine ligase [Tepidisphaeraceae bacterium]|jgi:UDP-N-acetylmuramoyl-tripeptide--D-alanyl-D-alanine ligase